MILIISVDTIERFRANQLQQERMHNITQKFKTKKKGNRSN